MSVSPPTRNPHSEPPHGSLERLPQDETVSDAVWPGDGESPEGLASEQELERRHRLSLQQRVSSARLSIPAINWAARRTEIVAFLLAMVIASAFIPHVLQFSHRNELEREIVPWLPFWQPLERLEYQLYDARFTARGALKPPARGKIAIVAIDQTSLNVMGQWPWPRDWHAKLVRRLKKAGARVITLDINFSDKQFPGPDGSLSRMDRALVDAVRDAGNVVITSGFRPQRKSVSGAKPLTTFLSTPFEELDVATPDIAINYVPPDIDGGTRRYTMYGVLNGAQIGSVAALSVALYQNMLDGNENKRYYRKLTAARWPASAGAEYSMPLSKMRFGDNELRLTPIFYWGPPGTFPTYSYSDVLDAQRYSDAQLRQKFHDRIVFVGGTADILKDLFSIPNFSAGSRGREIEVQIGTGARGSDVETQISGVEIHATVAAMMLEGKYIRANDSAATIGILFGLTLASALCIVLLQSPISRAARYAQLRATQAGFPFRVHTIVWMGLYIGLGGMANTLFWQACKWFFTHRDMWVIAVYPGVGSALAGVLMLLVLFGAESAERRKTATQMGRFLSPAIIDEILAHPEEEYPRSRRATATVIFTDLEGFTTYSENREPEQVVETLNKYMTRMVPIIREYGGEVDKYIGDAIMSFFGVPVPRYDHAARALMCAVAMQDECARFREETGIEFYMRVGIHTGEVIAGCMGSEDSHCEHLNYTVIGDTVNLASRLESKNKEFGSWIMCSAATYEAAPDIVEVEAVSTRIKGKSDAVDVLIVRGLKGNPEYDKRWGWKLTATTATDTLPEAQSEDVRALDAPVLALPSGQKSLEDTTDDKEQT